MTDERIPPLESAKPIRNRREALSIPPLLTSIYQLIRGEIFMNPHNIKTYHPESNSTEIEENIEENSFPTIGTFLEKLEKKTDKAILNLLNPYVKEHATKANLQDACTFLMRNSFDANGNKEAFYKVIEDLREALDDMTGMVPTFELLRDKVDGIVSRESIGKLILYSDYPLSKDNRFSELIDDIKIKKDTDGNVINPDFRRLREIEDDIGILEYYRDMILEEFSKKRQKQKNLNDKLNREIFEIYKDNDKRKATDMAIEYVSKELMKTYCFKSIENGDEEPRLHIYRDGIWVQRAFAIIDETVKKAFESLYRRSKTNTVRDHIISSTYIPEEDFEEKDVNIVCVQNGILNIKDRNVKSFSPKHFFTSKIPIEYNPEVGYGEIPGVFKIYLPEEDQYKTLQEIFGYCLLRACPLHKVFLFVGDGGNGKGTTLGILRRFLGCENVSFESMEVLCNLKDGEGRFAIANLNKKHANIVTETFKGSLKDTSNIKAISSGDHIKADRKGMNPLLFQPYAKLIFAANDIPRCRDEGYAMKRRWCVLKFEQKFIEKKKQREYLESLEEEGLSDDEIKKEKGKIHDQIQQYEDKICTEENMSGLLNWALDGLDRLLKNGTFSDKKTIEETERIINLRSNPFKVFLNEIFKEADDDSNYVLKKDMKIAYKRWCRINKIPTYVKDVVIKNVVEGQDYYVWDGQNDRGISCWRNVQIRPEHALYLAPEEKYKKSISNSLQELQELQDPFPLRIGKIYKKVERSENPSCRSCGSCEKKIYIESLRRVLKTKHVKNFNLDRLVELVSLEASNFVEEDDSEKVKEEISQLLKDLKKNGDLVENKPGIWNVTLNLLESDEK